MKNIVYIKTIPYFIVAVIWGICMWYFTSNVVIGVGFGSLVFLHGIQMIMNNAFIKWAKVVQQILESKLPKD